MLLEDDDELYIDDEVQEYIDFMESDEQEGTNIVTPKRVEEHREGWERMMNFFVAYPDYFVDLITPKESHFHLFFFQRIILRCMARCNTTYATFSRGTSKSFLADLSRYLTCMFIPRHNTTITAGTNKQAAEIAKQKVIDDLWVKFPFLSNEMQKRKIAGKLLDAYKTGQDYVEFNFKNGSSLGLGNVRGLRKESLILEEVIEQDPVKVNEVYLPLLNKPRTMSNGLINPKEPQSVQIYITTAGYQGTFAYQKMIETAVNAFFDPDHYAFLCGTYHIPLSLGLTAPKQIQDVINAPSFSKQSFEREYESRWSDAPVGALFTSNNVQALRQVKKVELKDCLTDKQKESGSFYAICADMAKDGSAETAVIVAKVTPGETMFSYKFVNLFTIASTDYLDVANVFKKTVAAYNAKLLIYDANGVGAGLRDWINKETHDKYTNEPLGGLGIINPPDKADKDLISYPKDKTICYEIKSGGQVGEQIHWFFFSRMSTNVITFPIKLADAIELYSKNKTFMGMSMRRKEQFMLPFKTMDKMEEELKNLDIMPSSDNMNDRLKVARRNSAIQKDFFSAAEYLVYGTNKHFEMNYYKTHSSSKKHRIIAIYE